MLSPVVAILSVSLRLAANIRIPEAGAKTQKTIFKGRKRPRKSPDKEACWTGVGTSRSAKSRCPWLQTNETFLQETQEFLAQIKMLCRPTSKAVERKALGARDGLDDVQVVV